MKKLLMVWVTASFVFAGTAEAKKGFADLDVNRDGKISKEECLPSKAWSKNFDNKDQNKDGFLTEDEIEAKNKGVKRKSEPETVG